MSVILRKVRIMKSVVRNLIPAATLFMVLFCCCTAEQQSPTGAGVKLSTPEPGESQLAETGPAVTTPVDVEPAQAKAVEKNAGETTILPEKPSEATTPDSKPVEPEPQVAKQPQQQQAALQKATEQATVVAEIGDYAVTKGELEQRLLKELRSYPAKRSPDSGPPDAEGVLMEMVQEKAMLIQGRKENLLAGTVWVKNLNRRDLINALLRQEVGGKIKITKAEIDQKVKSTPKLDRKTAERMLNQEKSSKLVNEFYQQAREKRNVQKLRYNFPKAAQIHQTLLYQPQKPRRSHWIEKAQIQDELTQEEKDIVLAKFEGGKVTLEDWFYTLHEKSPPKRPEDLNTIQGIDRLLEQTLWTAILVAEAKSHGLHKEPKYVTTVRNREDEYLLGVVKRKIRQDIEKPTDEQAREYFESHGDRFRRADTLRIEQVWCENIEAAQNAKNELNGAKDFESVRQQYSLKKKDRPASVTAETEGVFFSELWQAEPNQVVGPVKGFYHGDSRQREALELKWRVVRILTKKPGEPKKYSSNLQREIKSAISRQKADAALAAYGKELLEKYPHKIYADRIKDIDPLARP